MTTLTPFLMFQGRAEEAMNRYLGALPDSQVLRLDRYGADGPGAEGTVAHGEALLAGQRVRFFDSSVQHAFSFTPALSLFVTVPTEAELDRVVDALAVGGEFLMPTGDYGFSARFAWFNDEFGVSWQVNAEPVG
jgi:predicted 3-demethylubiquinone-9 3-methyltransferase (glyoxalase superfamily)